MTSAMFLSFLPFFLSHCVPFYCVQTEHESNFRHRAVAYKVNGKMRLNEFAQGGTNRREDAFFRVENVST